MSLRLDTESPIPLHHQLQSQLREAILSGEYAPGNFLPGEMELVSVTGVSRPTVRQAIERLARDGLVRRQRGRKTVVLQPPKATGAYRFHTDLPGRGAATSQVKWIKTMAPSAEAAAALALAPRGEVVEICRQRLAGGQVVAVDRIALPAQRVGSIEADGQPPDGTFYAALERRYGLIATAAEETLQTGTLDAETARDFGLKSGAIALVIKRRTVAGETPIEWRVTTIPAASFHASASLNRAELDVE